MLLVKPVPGGGLSHAGAEHFTPYGRAKVSWHRADGKLTVDVTVPPNSTAIIQLPGRESSTVGSGDHQFQVPYPDPSEDPTEPLPPRQKY